MKRLKRKDLLLLEKKLKEKIPNLRHAKEHYQSFMRRKTKKLVKQSKIITYQPKSLKAQTLLI